MSESIIPSDRKKRARESKNERVCGRESERERERERERARTRSVWKRERERERVKESEQTRDKERKCMCATYGVATISRLLKIIGLF